MKYVKLFSLAICTALFFAACAYSQDSREVSKTVPLKADGEISLDTYKGSIKVTTWDKPQVEIHAVIEADDNFDTEYSAEKVRDTDVRIDATESRIRIRTDYDNVHERHHGWFSWFENGSGSLPLVHYTITVPATASLSIKDYKSRSTVQGLRGDLKFNTYKGDAEIGALEGALNLETYKGEVRVEFNTIKDRCRVETFKGRVILRIPRKSGFDLDADLGYRTGFSTDFDFEMRGRERRHSNAEYRGPVNGGGPTLVLRSTKGSVDLQQR